MSGPVRIEELSALVDGELDASRAAEVRRAMESDPALRAEFDRLLAEDRQWTNMAERARFRPEILLPAKNQTSDVYWLVPLAAALLIVRAVTKIEIGPALQWGLHVIMLLFVVLSVILLSRRLEAEASFLTGS